MNSTINAMTVETQPAFGMPVYGRASVCSFETTAWAPSTATIPGSYVQVKALGTDTLGRDRHVAALVKGAFPGTSVWRPPNC